MPNKATDYLTLSKQVWRPLVARHPKLRSRIVEKCGEYFYEEIELEEVLDSAFTLIPEGQITNREGI